jgi:hypothetical protein
MSERRAITIALIAVVLAAMIACVTVLLLGAGTEPAAAAAILVAGIGVDRMAKLILDFGSPGRQ